MLLFEEGLGWGEEAKTKGGKQPPSFLGSFCRSERPMPGNDSARRDE
jgi:hypothetical protein